MKGTRSPGATALTFPTIEAAGIGFESSLRIEVPLGTCAAMANHLRRFADLFRWFPGFLRFRIKTLDEKNRELSDLLEAYGELSLAERRNASIGKSF